MKDRRKVIQGFQEVMHEVYDQYNLTSLRGLNHEYTLNGKQIVSWYFEVVRKGRVKYHDSFDFNKNFDDLIFCSDEILYFLAQMYLYRPFMNNPLNDGFLHGEKIVYPNEQNLEAKRYNMIANIVSEKLYNYWDRIGDVLAVYFPELIKPKQVYFVKIIDAIPQEFRDDENYKWLEEFKVNHYTQLNRLRKRNVHYITVDTELKYHHLNKVWSRDEMVQWVEDRNAIADFYRKQYDYTFEGFEKTLNLIKKVTEVSLSEIY